MRNCRHRPLASLAHPAPSRLRALRNSTAVAVALLASSFGVAAAQGDQPALPSSPAAIGAGVTAAVPAAPPAAAAPADAGRRQLPPVPPGTPGVVSETPQGVPFGSNAMRPDKTPIPLSTEPMRIDGPKVEQAQQKAVGMAEKRIENLNPQALPNADASGYKGELEQMAAIQRQIRMLELKQKQADLAVKLWSTVYDGEREFEADMAAREKEVYEKARAEIERERPPVAAPAAAPQAPVVQGQAQVQRAKGPEFAAPTGPSPAPAAGTPATAPGVPLPRAPQTAAPAPAGMASGQAAPAGGQEAAGRGAERATDPLPVVVSVLGAGDSIRAQVLVPYVGEFNVGKGSNLPNGMKVVAVTAEGVTVQDAKGRKIPLSFGDSVPRTRPSAPPMPAGGIPQGTPLPTGGVMF